MIRLQRGWVFPIVVIVLWIVAVAFTFTALTGMEMTLHSTQVTSTAQPEGSAS